MNNADYWRRRFSILEETAHKETQKTIRAMEEIYLDTQRSVQKEIESWYSRFAVNDQISLAEARKRLNAGQLEEFHWTVEQYIKVGEQAGLDAAWLKKLENASARFHISRLESIQIGIQQQLELLYGNQVDDLDSLLRKVAGNGYTRTAFEIQKGLGLGWDITAPDQKKLEALLAKPWTTDGRTFRDRCWINKNELVDAVSKNLTQGLLRGDSPAKIITVIQKQFGVQRYKAARLVHTETSYFNAIAAKESYKALEVDSVEIIETLDSSTCPICQGMDGKVVSLFEYEPGVTIPPFHPNCRGTTAPAIDPKYAGERAARNADGKVYYVPGNMTYPQWKKVFVDGGAKDGLTVATGAAIMDIVEQATGAKQGTPMGMREAVTGANPNYSRGSAYGVNCQRCVQTYELRRRGYDVTAKPRLPQNDIISWGSECFIQPGTYQYSWQAYTLGQTEAAVKNALANAPDGSRFSIYIKWQKKYGGSAHVFIAEKTGGVVHYIDPQIGNLDASDYFSRGSKGHFGYFRLDDKPLTSDPNIISATVEVK